MKFCPTTPTISHLLFTDDSLLFFKAAGDQAGVVNEILQWYALGTGQLINSTKCSILFGDSCPNERENEVRVVLYITQTILRRNIWACRSRKGE